LARPYAQRHFDELAASAEALIKLNPDPAGWQDWGEYARAAVQAARAQDEEHVLQACTRCHRAYRREYIETYRGRPLATE
jgi:cytochrome c553